MTPVWSPSVTEDGPTPTDPSPATLSRFLSLLLPVVAGTVGVIAWVLVLKFGAFGAPNLDDQLRPYPLVTRMDADMQLVFGTLIAGSVALVRRGRAGLWLRRGIGIGTGALLIHASYWTYYVRGRDCYRLDGCESWRTPWFFVDVGLVALAGGFLLWVARREPEKRASFAGLGLAVAALLSSFAWTYHATRVLRRFDGAALANARLEFYVEANMDFVPSDEPPRPTGPARPAIPTLGKLQCGGEWRIVSFPDRERCLPHRSLLTIPTANIEAIEVARPDFTSPESIYLLLRGDSVQGVFEAMRTAAGHRFVILNRRGRLVSDPVVYSMSEPSESILFTVGEEPKALERTLNAMLDR